MTTPELAEAASRTGDVALVRAALQWLSERTRAAPTEWALGIEARVRALLSEGVLRYGREIAFSAATSYAAAAEAIVERVSDPSVAMGVARRWPIRST